MSRKAILYLVVILLLTVPLIWYTNQKNAIDNRAAFIAMFEKMEKLNFNTKKLYQQVQIMSNDRECETDLNCHIAGIGVMSCGGYGKYVVYSTLHNSGLKIEDAIRNYNRKRVELNKFDYKVLPCGKKAYKIICYEERCVPLNEAIEQDSFKELSK